MFTRIDQAGVAELHLFSDPDRQLHAIIAIHSTERGPALGGCRCLPYANEDAALEDAIRLARGMTYKAVLAGVPQGGGKAVLLRPPTIADRTAYFQSFGRCVESLGGRYITAVDSGTSADDMQSIALATRHVVGTLSDACDPSIYTARGVLLGIQAASAFLQGRSSLRGLRVALQGLGQVGWKLAQMLHRAGARLWVSDLDAQKVARAVALLGATAVPAEQILQCDCEVFAPCGLGGILDARTALQLRAPIVAGSANNQLSEPAVGQLLSERGVLYLPDYVVNAGGLIAASLHHQGQDEAQIRAQVQRIGQTLTQIFIRASHSGLSTSMVADNLAQERLHPRQEVA